MAKLGRGARAPAPAAASLSQAPGRHQHPRMSHGIHPCESVRLCRTARRCLDAPAAALLLPRGRAWSRAAAGGWRRAAVAAAHGSADCRMLLMQMGAALNSQATG